MGARQVAVVLSQQEGSENVENLHWKAFAECLHAEKFSKLTLECCLFVVNKAPAGLLRDERSLLKHVHCLRIYRIQYFQEKNKIII